MKKLSVLVLVMGGIFLLGTNGLLLAQSPSGYTLSDVYYYLTEGTVPVAGGHTLEPPVGATPGDDQFQSLEQILDDIKAAFDQCNLTYDEISPKFEQGYYFFCTDTNYWGVREGTIPPPWRLNETTCNALTGWSWINGACWSDAIADAVSWNKGVGDDTSKTGSYEPNTAGDLKSRMEAAVAGRWSEICTSINGVTITTGMDGATGKPNISALAIADCVDGVRDLGPTISGSDWQSRSNTLKAWATAAGKSALPAVDYNGSNNEFDAACTGNFYLNTSTLAPGTNFSWAAACGTTSGGNWSTGARTLGYYSCSGQRYNDTSYPDADHAFRVVVRPAAE